jgi:outer membrane protein
MSIAKILLGVLLFVTTLYATNKPRTIIFEDVVHKAFNNSLELRVLSLDYDIAKESILEVESLYYPTITLGMDAQYTKNIDANEETLNSQTGYDSSSVLKLNYILYDFGKRDSQLSIERIKSLSVDHEVDKKKLSLQLELLNIYINILKLKEQISSYMKIKKIYNQIYMYQKRLYSAKQIDKVTLSQSAIEIVELESKIAKYRHNLGIHLQELSFLTNDTYTIFDDFSSPILSSTELSSYEETVEYKEYKTRIDQKNKELQSIGSDFYPKISFASSYQWINYDEKSLSQSLKLDQKLYDLGISISIPIFDGFRTVHQKRRAMLERKRLQMELELKKKTFIKNQKLQQDKIVSIDSELGVFNELIDKYRGKKKMLSKLSKTEYIDKITLLEFSIVVANKALQVKLKQFDKEFYLYENY